MTPRAGIGSLARLSVAVALVVVLVVAASAITGVAGPGDRRDVPTAPSVGPSLPTSAPSGSAGATTSAVTASAVVVPIRSADLSAEVAGTVRAVMVKEGQRVESGQVLIRLDATRQQAAVERAEAALERAEAAVERARAQRDLLPAKASEAERKAADAEITLAEADLETARTTLEQARVELTKRQLKAPFGGTVAGVETGVGRAVRPGEPLLAVADMSSWRFETKDLDELDVLRVAERQRVTIEVPALRGARLTGVVEQIHARGIVEGGVTYTAVIVPDRHEPRLRWNMSATVRFTGA